MDVYKRLNVVKDFIKEESKRLQNLLPIIDSIITKLQESNCESNGLSDAVDVLSSSCNSVQEANESFIEHVNKICSLLKPTIQWHSNKKEMLEMFYLDGNSPWCMWLSYNPSTEIDGLYKILEQRHANGLLKKLKNPRVGDFICCYDKKILFRAVITEISNTRVKVINVDRYNVKIIKLDGCYEITKDLCGIHAYSIQCCLTKDKKLEKKWNEDLGRLFQNTLKECRLTVRIVEEIQSVTPLFLVEMYAFNEALEVETNISNWILSRLLPEINNLSDDDDHVLDYFSDEALDPYLEFSNVLKSSSKTSKLENNKENIASSPKRSEESVSDSMQNVLLDDNCGKEKPRNRLAHLINLNTDTTLALNDSAIMQINGVSTNTDGDVYVADDCTSNSSYPDLYPSNDIGAHYRGESSVMQSSGLKQEKKSNDVYDGSMVNDLYDQLVIEDSIIPNNYIPTDDNRICPFYAKKGFCWKPSCKKQHTKIERDVWTSDTVESYNNATNTLNLPTVGTMVTLKVTHIVLCNTFYALLSDDFSGEDCESAVSLNKSLNSTEAKREFKLLKSPPCFGQLLIAHSKEKSMWLRALVRDVYDNSVLMVFFVDFGMTEEIHLDECRDIEPEYIHLPYQAVYCILANVIVDNSSEEAGKSFLELLLLDKEIEVKIIDRDIVNNGMEIIAFQDSININQLMIDQGYCLAFSK